MAADKLRNTGDLKNQAADFLVSSHNALIIMKLDRLFSFLFLVTLMPVYGVVDNNGNGMSDVWERRYNAVGVDPAVDEDGDNQSNLLESIAGTDPHDKDSVLEIESLNYRPEGLIVSWETQVGIKYRVESSDSLSAEIWDVESGAIVGHGGMMSKALNVPAETRKFYRLSIFDALDDPVNEALQSMMHDTDGDGMSDVMEIKAGLNPFDATSRRGALSMMFGDSVEIIWQTQIGKRYQIRRRTVSPVGEWQDEGVPYLGTGVEMTATVPISGTAPYEYTIDVADADTDEDGISDWEEEQVGMDPRAAKTDTLGAGDLNVLNADLLATSEVSVKAAGAVANITRMQNGGVKIMREGGVDEITVQYTITGTAVAGSDYLALPGSVTIPFGQDSVVIPVEPLAGSSMSLSESVILTVQDTLDYELGNQVSQQVNVIKEVVINVQDYGAIGDGVVDDTVGIQAAITALEQSSSHNTLYFPSGTYRLNTVVSDANTGTSLYRILEMGSTDLAGRDLVICGDGTAELYSTVSPERAHILVAHATFRSLDFYQMMWRKDSVPLRERPNSEPNGADGVSIVYADDRSVENVSFYSCEFNNCHGAMHTYGGTIKDNGKLNHIGFYHCIVSNPYGANTENSVSSWGGGQQCKIGSWVGLAEYIGNHFDGGGDDMTDETTSPGGRLKDGSHFGGPMHLDFRENTVIRMGVEAILQHSVNNSVGVTTSDFDIPAADGVSLAVVGVSGQMDNYEVGQMLNIRTLFTPTTDASNNIFEIAEVDESLNQLSLKNTGNEINAPAGELVASGRNIYLQNENATTALIENNVVDGAIPPGGRAFYTQSGITVIARSIIRNNYITGFWTGINLYEDTKRPIFPATRGTRVDSNVVVTRNPMEYSQTFTYGVQLIGGDEWVYGNLIMVPVSFKCMGIVARSENSLIQENDIGAWQFGFSGSYSLDRSIGAATGRTSMGGCQFIKNRTRGFDVGVGRAQWYQDVNYTVDGNISYEDALPVDPLALILNN